MVSIYVTEFSTTDWWSVVHDDAPGGSHTGTVDPATIQHTTNMDGSANHNFLIVTCPVCGSVSTHPAGGGANAPSVQQMFVNKCQSDGCPCGQVQSTDADALGESHVRLQVNRMDGPFRWQLG